MGAIKSFVIRAGRLSPRQKRGFDQYLSDYQLALTNEPWDWSECFGRTADVVIELGFGMGHTLVTLAQENPQLNFLGIEVHKAGIGHLAMTLHEQKIENVRIAPYDALEVLQRAVAAESLVGINIFFPDPWPKARHKKRRLIQPDFVHLVVSRLQSGGRIHLATDWEDYASQMLDVLAQNRDLVNLEEKGGFTPRPASRPLTKFEQRGLNLGHAVWDLIFQCK